jgi:hypothetical protein
MSATHISARAGAVRSWMPGPRRISVSSGRLWLTQAGDPQDHVLDPGAVIVLAARGRIAAEALTDCVWILADAL